MNYSFVQRFLGVVVATIGVLFSVSSVTASELTLPQQFTHDGLIFASGLTYTEETLATPLRLSFDTLEEIAVTGTEQKEVLAEQIITPYPKKLALTQATTLPTLAEALENEKKMGVTPTSTPTPTAALTPVSATPVLAASSTNGGLNADTLFAMANQKRAEAGLSAFEKHPDVCSLAESRKPELENEVYGSSSIHAGFRARDIPFRATENMISQQTEEQAMSWWMNSSLHRSAILGGTKYACVACQGKVCAMIFSSLEPK